MAGGATIATTIATLASLVYLYKYFTLRKKETWKEVQLSTYNKKEKIRKIIKDIIIVSIPIALSSLFASTTKTIDALTIVRIMKRYITESEATIKYGILCGKVDTLINLPFSFNIAFATVLVPNVASAIARGDEKTAKNKINFSMIISLMIGIICTVIINIFAEQIIKMLFPNATSGVQMLKIASLDILLVVLIQTINGALQGLGKVNVSVIAFGIGGIIKLILNVTLLSIQEIGIYGAIISTIISHLVSFLICLIVLKKNIGNVFTFKLLLKSYGEKRYKKTKNKKTLKTELRAETAVKSMVS